MCVSITIPIHKLCGNERALRNVVHNTVVVIIPDSDLQIGTPTAIEYDNDRNVEQCSFLASPWRYKKSSLSKIVL